MTAQRRVVLHRNGVLCDTAIACCLTPWRCDLWHRVGLLCLLPWRRVLLIAFAWWRVVQSYSVLCVNTAAWCFLNTMNLNKKPRNKANFTFLRFWSLSLLTDVYSYKMDQRYLCWMKKKEILVPKLSREIIQTALICIKKKPCKLYKNSVEFWDSKYERRKKKKKRRLRRFCPVTDSHRTKDDVWSLNNITTWPWHHKKTVNGHGLKPDDREQIRK